MRAYNDRGSVVLCARVTEKVRPGTAHSFESCADYSPVGAHGHSPDRAGCVEHPDVQALHHPHFAWTGVQQLPYRGGALGAGGALTSGPRGVTALDLDARDRAEVWCPGRTPLGGEDLAQRFLQAGPGERPQSRRIDRVVRRAPFANRVGVVPQPQVRHAGERVRSDWARSRSRATCASSTAASRSHRVRRREPAAKAK